MGRPARLLAAAMTLIGACSNGSGAGIDGQDVQLTLLHTSDIHSRLLPYDLNVGEIDRRLGLAQELEPFGGAARMATVLSRERARAGRVLHVDSGDIFQGAPIFNFFQGEPEIRFLDLVQADVMVMGNHEFDLGGVNLYDQLEGWALFPVLAANYVWEDPTLPYNSHLGEVSAPFMMLNLQGLRLGIIGLANLSSMNSIYDTGNRLGITPLNIEYVTQHYVDTLKPIVDLVIVNSHLGLTGDEVLIETVSDIDIVMGGHHHVVLNPPKVVIDPLGRAVPMVHSGAFAKFVGRFDVVVRQCDRIASCRQRYAEQTGREPPANDWEVVTQQYEVFPIDSTIEEDPYVVTVLEDYVLDMDRQTDLNELVGYAPNRVRRFGVGGGDSQLGNLVATAMRRRRGVESDFSLTNTLGVRADFVPGPVNMEQMFNVFPFENTITTLNLSGAEVQELFDFVADRSASRGSSTQAQIAGAAVVLDTGTVCPLAHRQSDGSCAVEPRPLAQRILIGDASPPPSDACRLLQKRFDECSERVARSGCDDDVCLDSICEREARQEVAGCSDDFEPQYRTDPCADDAECQARSPRQRCFLPAGKERGRCYTAVVDNFELLDPYGAYKLATNDYIARGGSGFRVLGRNTSQQNLGIPLRDVLVDYIKSAEPCTDNQACSVDTDCPPEQMCACSTISDWQGQRCTWESHGEDDGPQCTGNSGRCVLAACVDDVTTFRGERGVRPSCGTEATDDAASQRCWCNARRWAMAACQELACINEAAGAVADGRQTMVLP
jgi:5'-nucleotidase